MMEAARGSSPAIKVGLSRHSGRAKCTLTHLHLTALHASSTKKIPFHKISINILVDVGRSPNVFADVRARFDDGPRARDDDGSEQVKIETILSV